MLAAGVLLAPNSLQAGEAVLLLQLFPLRNLGRISIFLPNRASKLCVSNLEIPLSFGFISSGFGAAQALSCLRLAFAPTLN